MPILRIIIKDNKRHIKDILEHHNPLTNRGYFIKMINDIFLQNVNTGNTIEIEEIQQ